MFYRTAPPRTAPRAGALRHLPKLLCVLSVLLAVCPTTFATAAAQVFEKELAAAGERVEIVVENRSGRVTVVAAPAEEELKFVRLRAESSGKPVGEGDVKTEASGRRVRVAVADSRTGADRVDLTLRVPARSRLRIETEAGAVDVSGPLMEAAVSTDTGTIRADVPTDAVAYDFRWTASRPRFYSEIGLAEVKEGRGGRFSMSGRLGDRKAKRDQRVTLDFETERGVVLFGVDAASVPSDLRERQLTEAARAIIRSGNQDLIESIRRIAPRFVGEYAETLPLRSRAPSIRTPGRANDVARLAAPEVVRLNASVTDRHGRAVAGLAPRDFAVTENGEPREVTEVVETRAPFNLVLLLDVSGSVEEHLDFIRKAATAFVNTVGPQDRVAIISFRDDVQLISEFTTDKQLLVERLKEIEAGGATALYDALAYTLVHTLRPLRGERTAVVILSDGDDNRSFVPFSELIEAVSETGALIYPLYIPSGLIPAASAPAPLTSLDPVRTRYLTLTSRAAEEGRQLAEVSGGVFHPVTRLDELQRAYDDVVAQLRTAYTISYSSNLSAAASERRVRVRVNRDGLSVRLSPAVSAGAP